MPSGQFSIVSLSGFSTAMRRGAVSFSTSRMAASNCAASTRFVGLGDADAPDELADASRRHAAPAQAGERRHPGIVPACDMPVLHQPDQPAFRQHRMAEIEARELILQGPRRRRQMLDQPVVERPVVLELHGADRMGDMLDGVGLAVGEIVGRVDFPARAGARMGRVQDAVERRVAQVDVAARHVDPGAQHPCAFREFAGLHAAQQVQILRRRAVAEGAVDPRFGQRAARGAHLRRRLVVDIGEAPFDQNFRPFVEPVEMVRRVVEMIAPVEAEPAHILLNGVDIKLFFFERVGVVEAQMAAPAEFRRHAEIQADRFGVPDMEIAVGLRREAGDDGAFPPAFQIGADDLANEVARAVAGMGVGHGGSGFAKKGCAGG